MPLYKYRGYIPERYRLSESAKNALGGKGSTEVARQLLSIRGFDSVLVSDVLEYDMGMHVSEQDRQEIRRIYMGILSARNGGDRPCTYISVEGYEKDLLYSTPKILGICQQPQVLPKEEKTYEGRGSRLLRYATAGLATAAVGLALTVGSFFNYKTKQADVRKNVVAAEVQKSNPGTPPKPQAAEPFQQVKEPEKVEKAHKVKWGESLWRIARKEYRTESNKETADRVTYLIKQNPWLAGNPNLIYPGQEIRL